MYNDVLELAFEHAGYEYKEVLEYFWNTEGFKIHTEYEEDDFVENVNECE